LQDPKRVFVVDKWILEKDPSFAERINLVRTVYWETGLEIEVVRLD